VRLVPEVFISSLAQKKSGRRPFLCFVLHRMGFLLRPRLRAGPVGSYPAFSTLLRTTLATAHKLSALLRSQSGAGRYIFCDTFRRPELLPRTPPLSRGMLPSGVRTFLWGISLHQRPPATTSQYHGCPLISTCGFMRAQFKTGILGYSFFRQGGARCRLWDFLMQRI
jgi:hypothetical protein